MDAWGTLLINSTLASGDAWEHLNALEGGGTGTYIILADGMEVEMNTGAIEVLIEQTEVEILIDQQETYIDIDNTPIEGVR